MKVVGILIVVALIAYFEISPMAKKKEIKDLWVFSFLLLIGTVLSIMLAIGVTIPNPLDGLTKVLKPVTNFILGLLD
ncbi:hypothetical protein [Chengkuizengella marina]|uniref:Uncharacterized protein n=1 Tax=Chengkuizengella marina TaxID=2507566 RepID=A0A6N9Q7P4_9BACL|nr:hypothetical protein [Chengkuizengella marina]NBI30878.1 hypothetical protein [Chengkuizengella marina]